MTIKHPFILSMIFDSSYEDDWMDDTVSVSFMFYMVYAILHFLLYIGKLLFFLMVYAYFWYWGGLEDPNDPYNTDDIENA